MVFSSGDKVFLFCLTNEHVNEVKVANFWHHSGSDKKRHVNGSCLGLRTINSLSLLHDCSFIYFFLCTFFSDVMLW